MAQVVVFDEIGGPEVLRIRDRPVTEPAAHEVRIKVEAVGVNRADQMLRSGVYAFLPQLPGSRLGVEAAGVVDALEFIEGSFLCVNIHPQRISGLEQTSVHRIVR